MSAPEREYGTATALLHFEANADPHSSVEEQNCFKAMIKHGSERSVRRSRTWEQGDAAIACGRPPPIGAVVEP